MRVIDSHVHFPAAKILDDGGKLGSGVKGMAAAGGSMPGAPPATNAWLKEERTRWKRAWRFPEEEKVGEEEAITRWKAECDPAIGLEKVVFVTAGSNDFASSLMKKNPENFLAYAHHDPLLPDALERLDKALGPLGLKGYKLLGPQIEVSLTDKRFYPLWDLAQEKGVPLLIHFGIMGGAGGIANHININPIVIHDVAKAFPNLPIIIPHFGCGYVFETLNLCWACPNIFIDTSGSNQWMRWMPYELNLEILFRKFRETMGASRILFGSDSSWFPRGFAKAYLDEQVRSMVYVGYSEAEVDDVLYGNAASLLKLI
ncbi:hypothetical protein MASR2M78_19580 [Treponema sp.]